MKKTFVSYPVFNYKRLKCVSTFWDTMHKNLSQIIAHTEKRIYVSCHLKCYVNFVFINFVCNNFQFSVWKEIKIICSNINIKKPQNERKQKKRARRAMYILILKKRHNVFRIFSCIIIKNISIPKQRICFKIKRLPCNKRPLYVCILFIGT